MKVGDLVELSSRAKSVKYNRSLVGKIGIVTEKANPSSIHELYFVHWFSGSQGFMNRNELKFARRKK